LRLWQYVFVYYYKDNLLTYINIKLLSKIGALKNVSDADAVKLSGYQEDVTRPMHDSADGADAVSRSDGIVDSDAEDQDYNILKGVELALAKVNLLVFMVCTMLNTI
jgi:hypothetical protein